MAGSVRRFRETVGDVDLVAAPTSPTVALPAFCGAPGVERVWVRGATKASAVLEARLGADLRSLLLLTTGCYSTKVYSAARPTGMLYEERQWFTIGGLVPLSQPSGRECRSGFSRVESSMNATDVLINIGVAPAGRLVASVASAEACAS